MHAPYSDSAPYDQNENAFCKLQVCKFASECTTLEKVERSPYTMARASLFEK